MTAVLNPSRNVYSGVVRPTQVRPVALDTAARSAKPKLRLTSRGRLVLTTLVGIPIVAAVMFASLNGGGATASLESGELTYVTVDSGESLWALAESIAPGSDPRDVIADIVSLNRLSSADIYAGQQIAIPTAYAQ